MWGTIAHLERQPGLVFSLILAPAQQARINRQDRFICGKDQDSRCARSLPQALNLTDIQYVHVTVESNDNYLLPSDIIFGI